MTSTFLKDLIAESKDGEWGKGEPFRDAVQMAVIRGTDFESVRVGALSSVPVRYVPRRIADRKTLRPNDLLIETAGGSRDRPTGRTLFVKASVISRSELPLTCASFSRFIRLRPDCGVNPRYLFWHLQALYGSGHMLQYHTQHTGVARFQWTTFSTRECLELPQLPVQEKIAAILSAYDDLIENNLGRITILEDTAQALYHEWFLRFGFPGRERARMVDSPLGEIPEGWKVTRLGELVEIEKGKKPKVLSDTFEDGLVPYLLIASMKGGPPKYAQLDKMVLAEPDDVVMVMDGASSGVASCGVSGAVGSTLARLRPCDETDLSPFILLLLLRQREDEIRSKNVGAAIPHANKEYLSRMEIALPPRKITNAFDQICRPLFGLIWNLTHANQTLRNTRDLLLARLVSGEVDVSDLNINTGALDT